MVFIILAFLLVLIHSYCAIDSCCFVRWSCVCVFDFAIKDYHALWLCCSDSWVNNMFERERESAHTCMWERETSFFPPFLGGRGGGGGVKGERNRKYFKQMLNSNHNMFSTLCWESGFECQKKPAAYTKKTDIIHVVKSLCMIRKLHPKLCVLLFFRSQLTADLRET